ncbi:response regulator [Lacibacterium aquatile]|uniref:Response regulator n=1 Tax=Lacibacterium aquatile TaxID=1168082 RepID=A0ABW5DLW0_9PROT
MLNGAQILICEDEPFIALHLATSVEDAGGKVIGPAASIAEAFSLLDSTEVVGAILDVHLIDGDITPIAERLLASSIPMVVQTGVGLPDGLKSREPAIPVLSKPVLPLRLIEILAGALSK